MFFYSSWNSSWDHPKSSLTEVHLKSVRKAATKSTRLPHKDIISSCYNNDNGKISPDLTTTTKRITNGKESPLAVLKNAPTKIIEPSPVKSAIPTPRRLATPTLIPRAARAISATGRSHNT